MSNQTIGIIWGFINILIGIIFLFFNKKIIKIQGDSKKGDIPVDMRINTFKVVGVLSLIGGIYLLYKYL